MLHTDESNRDRVIQNEQMLSEMKIVRGDREKSISILYRLVKGLELNNGHKGSP